MRIRGTGNKDYMMNFESLKSHAEKFKDISIKDMAVWKNVIIRPQVIRNYQPVITNTTCTFKATFDIKLDENTIRDNVSLKN